MRCSVFALILVALAASPLGASAQTGEEDVASEPSTEGLVQLETTGLEGAPATRPPSRTPNGYTQGEMELRVKRAKLGLIAPSGVLVPGAVVLALGLSGECKIGLGGPYPESCNKRLVAGTVLTAAGVVGIIVAGGIVAARKRELRRLQEGLYSQARRVQWDLAQSRLVF